MKTMMLTDAERQALRRRCSVVSGFVPTTPADDFAAMAAWCADHDTTYDRYGDGGAVGDLERKVAALVGKPAAALMPSGVMAQLAAVRVWCGRAGVDRFGFHPTSHLALHEDQAYAALMRLQAVPLGERARPLVAADLDAVVERLACAIVELPIREAGGLLPSWDALDALKRAALDRACPLHVDGARLWECAAFYGRDVAAIADGFGSVYVSLYKGIGAFAGAVLAGDAALVAEARVWRRRMGGTLHHLAPFAVSAGMRLDARLALMPALHARTLRFAAALQTVDGLRTTPTVPQVNLLHLHVDAPADAVLDARDRIAADRGLWLVDRVRPADVPGWSTTEIYVGDALLATEDDRLVPAFDELVRSARAA